MGKTKIIQMHHIPVQKKRYDPSEEKERSLDVLKKEQRKFNKSLKRADKLKRIEEGQGEMHLSDDDVSDDSGEEAAEEEEKPEEAPPFDE